MNDMNEMIDNVKSIFLDSTTTQSPADALNMAVIPLERSPSTINQCDAVHAQHIQQKLIEPVEEFPAKAAMIHFVSEELAPQAVDCRVHFPQLG